MFEKRSDLVDTTGPQGQRQRRETKEEQKLLPQMNWLESLDQKSGEKTSNIKVSENKFWCKKRFSRHLISMDTRDSVLEKF